MAVLQLQKQIASLYPEKQKKKTQSRIKIFVSRRVPLMWRGPVFAAHQQRGSVRLHGATAAPHHLLKQEAVMIFTLTAIAS